MKKNNNIEEGEEELGQEFPSELVGSCVDVVDVEGEENDDDDDDVVLYQYLSK